MPGQPVCARARFQFPPAIHPRELPAATGVTAIIIRQALRFPRFAAPTLSQNIATRNRKNISPCAEAVDDSTCLWKPEENWAAVFVTLDAAQSALADLPRLLFHLDYSSSEV
jgi:hypothetical protein